MISESQRAQQIFADAARQMIGLGVDRDEVARALLAAGVDVIGVDHTTASAWLRQLAVSVKSRAN